MNDLREIIGLPFSSCGHSQIGVVVAIDKSCVVKGVNIIPGQCVHPREVICCVCCGRLSTSSIATWLAVRSVT